MNPNLLARCITLTLAVGSLQAVHIAANLSPAEVRALEAQAEPATVPAWALTDAERAELAAHQAAAGDLEQLRGGALTQREWTYILIGAVVVLLLVVIF